MATLLDSGEEVQPRHEVLGVAVRVAVPGQKIV
jgi:hypothetical protein